MRIQRPACPIIPFLLLLLICGCGREASTDDSSHHTATGRGKPDMETREAPEEFFEAINSGRFEVVRQMVLADRNLLRATRIGGRSALHQAAFRGELAMARWLIERGADVNARTEYGWTPLHYAAAPEDESVALLLIAKGAEVNVANDDGDTPLHFAASFGKLDMAKSLLQNGADRLVKNQSGQTPLDSASTEGWEPMIQLLSAE